MLLAALLMISAVAAALAAKPAEASHYRSAQLSWEKGSSTNQANFKSTIGARGSFYGNPAVGATVYETLYFGDGDSAWVPHEVIMVDQTNDWMLAEGTTSHTYGTAGPYTATVSTCCRLSGPSHINNPDGNFYLQTKVDFGATTASPVSSISPIVDCQKNATCRFVVPATDPDGQGLSYRLATPSDGFDNQPSGATIDSGNGVYSWDTTGATLAPTGYDTYYSTQVIIENLDSSGKVISKTPVDFFIRLSDTASTNNPPEFDSPTPADGHVIDVEVGSEATFDVAAHDDDSGDKVTLDIQGKPSAATFTTSAANPANGKFSWTPSSAGSTILTLTAKDQLGLGATQRSVTINAKAVTNKPPTADAGGPYEVNEGSSVTLSGSGTDEDGTIKSYAWDLDEDGSFDDSTEQNPTFTPDDGPADTKKVSLQVTDDKDVKSDPITADVTVKNVAPTITNLTGASQALTGKSVTFKGTATDPSGADTTAGFKWLWTGGTSTDTDQNDSYKTSFSSCGSQTVSATAMDKDGGVSAPKSSTGAMSVYDAKFQQPIDEGMLNTVQKGRVVPVKISVGCGGSPLTGLKPAIQLLKGDQSTGNETSADAIETFSSSAADTTGVMRTVDGGYIYNLQVPSNAAVGDLLTVRVRPFGDSNTEAGMYAVFKIKK